MEGKVVCVTGSASGMGRAEALQFVQLGCAVAMGDVNMEGLFKVKRECDLIREDSAFAFYLDCGDPGSIKEFAKRVRDNMGSIDILVNNAGVSSAMPVTNPDDKAFQDSWNHVLQVNLTAQVLLTRAFLSDLIRRPGGRVINVASTEGSGATLFASAYTASKHGSLGLTKSLALELGPYGCTVNCIQPGPILTGMTEMIPEYQRTYYATRMVPLRRYGQPQEVAAIVALIAHPSTTFLNGACIPVDGGLLANNALLPKRDWWSKI